MVPAPGTPLAPESARADRINLGSTYKAVMKGDLNSILSNRRKDKLKLGVPHSKIQVELGAK